MVAKLNLPWNQYIPKILPLLIAIVFSPLLAYFVASGDLLYALALAVAIPVAILMNRYPFSAFIIWMVVVPLVPPHDSSRYLYWVIHRSLMHMAVTVNILSRMLKLKEHSPVRLGWPDLTMVCYLALGIVAILLNEDLGKEMRINLFALYDRTFVCFVIYWLVRFLKPTERDLEWLVPIMAGLCFAESIIGLVSWFRPEMMPKLWIVRKEFIGERVTGTFGEPGAYTACLIFFMIFIFQSAMVRQKGLYRLLYLGLFDLGLVMIFFSFSRGSWLAGLVALAILAFLYPRTIIPIVSTGAGIMLLLLTTILSRDLAWAQSRLDSVQSAGSRLVLANAGWQMVYEKPIFGWGYSSYDLYDWRYMERVGEFVPRGFEIKQGTSHNAYLTILAEMGIVGLFLYLFPIIWWLGLTYKIWPRLPFGAPLPGEPPRKIFVNWRFLVMLWTNIIFVVVVSQFFDTRFHWFMLGEFWFTLGLIANIVDEYLHSDDIALPDWIRYRIAAGAK